VFYVIDLLSAEDLLTGADYLASAEFTDGIETAGQQASTVKHNLQAQGFAASDFAGLVRQRLAENVRFKLLTIPRHMSALMLSRYETGMEYGVHHDNALINAGRLRTDLSYTLFLSPPDTYVGGELAVRTGDVERTFKLPAGSLLLYPSGTPHRVRRIESGTRHAVVGWVQSMVADPGKRAILSDLSLAQSRLLADGGSYEVQELIGVSYANLLRMWVEN
jgi:PKHD-type hydroxylase